jgi:hypothetical protein
LLIKPLQALFTYARKDLKMHLPNEPYWKRLFLKEPDPPARVVRAHEEELLTGAFVKTMHCLSNLRATLVYAKRNAC